MWTAVDAGRSAFAVPAQLAVISSCIAVNSPLSSFITTHSTFILGLKRSFSVNPSHGSLLFLLQD